MENLHHIPKGSAKSDNGGGLALSDMLLENLFDGVYYVDRDRTITYWNKSAERITGFDRSEVLGSSCSHGILRHINDMGTELCDHGCPLKKTLQDGRTREIEVFLHHKDGHRVPVAVRAAPVFDDQGGVVGAVEVFNDISRRKNVLKELQQLRQEVYLDELTQIGNRKFANLTLDARMVEQKEHKVNFGVVFCDIDHFKRVNDTYGHDIGDRVLSMVARSLEGSLREMDVACRWGGEEFLLIIPNTDLEGLGTIAERARMFVERSWFDLEEQRINVTISMGGAVLGAGETMDFLIRRADENMYASKQGGRNRVTLS
ncbi:sensor domain-containing diguanylate cyclase [Desulfovibrio ferrophilus]|nr:sensor domain-containing diguanylate cyclase [Desulfovibrio ferrophilus]